MEINEVFFLKQEIAGKELKKFFPLQKNKNYDIFVVFFLVCI